MKFCIKCDNMYYISIDNNNEDQLIYYCRFCGHKDEQLTEDGVIVLKTELKKSEQKFNHMINKYTKLDPTLPRLYTMKCPAVDCDTHKNEKPSPVIYMRYDDDAMKHLYICEVCDTVWKTDEHK